MWMHFWCKWLGNSLKLHCKRCMLNICIYISNIYANWNYSLYILFAYINLFNPKSLLKFNLCVASNVNIWILSQYFHLKTWQAFNKIYSKQYWRFQCRALLSLFLTKWCKSWYCSNGNYRIRMWELCFNAITIFRFEHLKKEDEKRGWSTKYLD